ncbi:MAG TPA: DUF1707 domain-containing protein [Streptosporangiaceae bacterium]|nr:DUF1707 domain-containing protein [Streptosporangiaceae bacterium]
MNATQDDYRLPQIKASDAERDAVVAALGEHFQAGRLTSEELEERTGRVLAARTLGELDELTTDLPAPRPAPPAGPAVTPHRPGYLTMLPWAVPLAALVIVGLTVGASTGHQGWGVWWVVPAALIVARRVARGRGARGDFRDY